MEKVKVSISNKQREVKIPSGVRLLIRRCCNAVLHEEAFEHSAEISVSFVNNEEIKRLNSFYRHKDIATDVLSFPLGENGNYDVKMCIRDRYSARKHSYNNSRKEVNL